MAASSVTGVGQGSADKAGQKGSEHLFVGVEKLIGTRTVLSGYVTLSGGTATVKLPENLPGVWSNTFDGSSSASDYIIIVQAFSGNATHVSAIATTSNVQNFTISGTGTDVVFWQIIRHSMASVTSFPTHN